MISLSDDHSNINNSSWLYINKYKFILITKGLTFTSPLSQISYLKLTIKK